MCRVCSALVSYIAMVRNKESCSLLSVLNCVFRGYWNNSSMSMTEYGDEIVWIRFNMTCVYNVRVMLVIFALLTA